MVIEAVRWDARETSARPSARGRRELDRGAGRGHHEHRPTTADLDALEVEVDTDDRVAAQRRVVLALLGNDWIKGVPQ